MNKLFIGLLIIAAGTGIFFLVRKKNNQPELQTINKEWIIGKWQTISVTPLKDSAESTYRVEFHKDGLVTRSQADSAIADSSHFKWTKDSSLVIKQTIKDSTGQEFIVELLTKDSLKVKGEEQTYLFSKMK
jgi:hypothetical protein